jgi:hypothetical protein
VKRIVILSLAFSPALALSPALAGASHYDNWRDWQYKDTETIQKSFNVSAASDPKKLLVDNMHGIIHVSGYNGSEIRVTVHKEARGRSASALEDAKREVKLDISQQGNYVRLYEDGPWRSSHGNNYRGEEYYGYHVNFDYDIEVPSGTGLNLKGFNDKIEVKGTTGDFDIHGFNGGIEMEDIAGSGWVETFNGGMKVTFRKNPDRDSTFKTFNGSLDIYFQPDFNADLHFKTFHGGVYSDFDVAPLPVKVGAGQNLNGKFVYRSDGGGSAQVGKGGPSLTFSGFNGSIRLHSKAI